jgi:hypothetical protein
MTIGVLQALAISHRSGLQMAIVSHVLVHNTCYHFIALVGWEGGALVIQVLPSSYKLKTLAADDDHKLTVIKIVKKSTLSTAARILCLCRFSR